MVNYPLPQTKVQARIEGLKEFGRVVLFSAITAALLGGQAALGLITDPIVNVVLGGFILSLLKAWDRYQHKNPETDSNGLAPF